MFLGLDTEQKRILETEVIPYDARHALTRMARALCNGEHNDENQVVMLCKQNRFINIAHVVLARPRYILEADDWGEYEASEYAWHFSQMEIIFFLPDTVQLTEILCDLIEVDMLNATDVNKILALNNCSFRIKSSNSNPKVSVDILSMESIEAHDNSSEHPNIRLLVNRMQSGLREQDASAVLHSSASIFETLAKDVVNNPNVNNQPLGSFFESYRKRSKLPDPICDYILKIYQTRNTEPLAGHGSTEEPEITVEEATILAEFTLAIVKSERKLQELALNSKHTASKV